MSAQSPSSPQPPPAPGDEPHDSGGRSGLDLRILLALAAVVVIAGCVALLTVSGGSSRSSTGRIGGVKSARYDGLLALPAGRALPLALRNYNGEMVNIAQYRGKAVLVTFLYTNCPDVCPLIAANLRVAQNLMAPAEAAKVSVIAVSVDPRGDTPKAVAAFLARHEMTGRMKYLVGDAHELARVWKAWGVGSERDAQQPEFVNHSGIVYGVSASGKVTTLYAASFTPQEVAHDAVLLASS